PDPMAVTGTCAGASLGHDPALVARIGRGKTPNAMVQTGLSGRILTRSNSVAPHKSSGFSQPILSRQVGDTRELSLVVRYDGAAQCHGLRGDEQIVTADHAACPFKLATDLAINGVGWRLEREDFQDPEHGLKLSRQPGRALFRRPKPKFRRDNDAGADTGLANLADALGDATARIPD